MNVHSLLTLLISLLAFWPLFPPVSSLHLFSFSSLACPRLSSLLSCRLPSLPFGLTPAKLMNGYMVLANGGSQPRSSPSLSSRTLSRPAGDIIVNMDSEPPFRKMDTVVKLDAVSFVFTHCRAYFCCIMCMQIVGVVALLYVQSFLPASVHVPLLPASPIVCINPCVVLCDAPYHRRLTLL